MAEDIEHIGHCACREFWSLCGKDCLALSPSPQLLSPPRVFHGTPLMTFFRCAVSPSAGFVAAGRGRYKVSLG